MIKEGLSVTFVSKMFLGLILLLSFFRFRIALQVSKLSNIVLFYLKLIENLIVTILVVKAKISPFLHFHGKFGEKKILRSN